MDKPQKKTPKDWKGDVQPGEVNRGEVKEGETMQEEWRELVQRIQEETDTHKLVNLVQELIGKFDEERLRKTRRPQGAA